MAVTPDDVRRMAQLARLSISESSLPEMVTQLNGILDHMQVLADVEISSAADPFGAKDGMPLRPDERSSTPLARERSAFAPEMRDGFFLVPRLATHGSMSGASGGGQSSAKPVRDADADDEDEG